MMWESETRRLVKVGHARWIDPLAVQAIEPTSSGKARVHLAGGGLMDIPTPSNVAVSEFIESLLDKLATTVEREAK